MKLARSWYPVFAEVPLAVIAAGRWSVDHWTVDILLVGIIVLIAPPVIARLKWKATAIAVGIAILPSALLRNSLGSIYEVFGHSQARLVLCSVGLVTATVLGSALVSCTIRTLKKGAASIAERDMFAGGNLIGLLERTIVFGSVLAHHPEAAALVVLIKSVARFPELSAASKADGTERVMAETFIIGTLLSLLIAFSVGYAVLYALNLNR
jgi:hypothetical protein